jgi:Signal transduction histidine kinase
MGNAMYVGRWLTRWTSAAAVCLIVAIGCGAYLLWKEREDRPPAGYAINQARIQVNEIVLFLERNHEAVAAGDEAVRDDLRRLSEDKGIALLFALPDGSVVFRSGDERQPAEAIDVRTALHYDLYRSKADEETFEAAFPIIGQAAQAQIGNAIFTLPASLVLPDRSSAPLLFPIMLVFAFVLLVIALLLLLNRKIKRDVLQPIVRLKDYSEAILKGDYERKAEHVRRDEVGDAYAMFDQMRLEIMHLSKRRDEQDKAQKELISNLSHELKTPLTTMKAYLEAIEAGVCPDMDAVLEYVRVMQTHTHKMTARVDDLLLHALRELGQISVAPVERYSREMLLSILRPIGHSVRAAGVSFIGPEPENLPNVLVNADENRLEQVISNLVANALKHTSPGDSIRVGVEREEDRLTVTIEDTGRGILPQDMPFIFERYFQGRPNDFAAARKNEGTGLGLSICRHIIEAHGGTISFQSAPGRGTAFYFSILLC